MVKLMFIVYVGHLYSFYCKCKMIKRGISSCGVTIKYVSKFQ